jgi:hypothetical protein
MFFFGDFTAFFAADFFAAEDILSNKKGCWQPGLDSVLSVRYQENCNKNMELMNMRHQKLKIIKKNIYAKMSRKNTIVKNVVTHEKFRNSQIAEKSFFI